MEGLPYSYTYPIRKAYPIRIRNLRVPVRHLIIVLEFAKTNLGIVTLRFLAWDCYMPWTGLWYPFHTRSHSGWHNRSTSPNQTTPHPPDNSRLSSQMFPCSPYWKHYRAFLRTPHCWLSPESWSLYPCRRSESSQTIHSISRAIQC